MYYTFEIWKNPEQVALCELKKTQFHLDLLNSRSLDEALQRLRKGLWYEEISKRVQTGKITIRWRTKAECMFWGCITWAFTYASSSRWSTKSSTDAELTFNSTSPRSSPPLRKQNSNEVCFNIHVVTEVNVF